MILELQLLVDEPFYDLQTDFDGVDYSLYFAYNQRLDQWFMSISDATGAPIVRGIAIVCNWGLLSNYSDERLPRGILMCQTNVATDTTPPGLAELGPGRRCNLVYLTADEVTAVADA